MSSFSFPFNYFNGRRRSPVIAQRTAGGGGATYLDEQPIYGDTSLPMDGGGDGGVNRAAQLPMQPPMPRPDYFALQNARSDNQRAATMRVNANNASGAAAAASAAPLPMTDAGRNARQGYIARNQGRADSLNTTLNPPPPVIVGRQPAQQAYKPANPKDRATAYRDYTLGGMDPAAAEKRIESDFSGVTPATYQRQPPGIAPPPTGAAPATQPSSQAPPPPATPAASHGKEGIQMSEQIAREMLRALSVGNPSSFEQIKPEFVATVGKYGADGNALWDKWTQEGSLGQFDYARGQTTSPAQPQMIAAPNAQQGTGGIAMLPGGQTVVTNPNGRQVGGPIAQGAPLPPQTSVVMGAQPGFSPAPMLPTGSPIPQSTPSSNLVNAGTGPGGQATPIPFPGSAYTLPTSALMASPAARPQAPQPSAPPVPPAPPQPAQQQRTAVAQQQQQPAPRTPQPRQQQAAGGTPIGGGTAKNRGGVVGTGPNGELRYGNGTNEMSQQFPGNAPRVATADQHAALPSGAMYYDPAGNLRRKQ